MKKHNLIKVVSITILAFVILTWIFTTASFSSSTGTITESVRSQVGFYELFNYPSVAMSYFGYVLVFMLMVGVFYAVISKTGAYRELLDRIVKRFKGREKLFLATTMVLLAVITSFTGLSVALMFVFPLVIAIVIMMGYNKLTAAGVTVGSVMIGLMGTTFGATAVNNLNNYLGTTSTTQIWSKLIILVLGLALLIFNVLKYASKTKNDVDAVKEELIPEKVKGSKNIWPLVIIFDLTLIIIAISQMPWSSWGITLFDDMTSAVTGFEVFGFAIFGKILGGILSFGTWTIFDFAVLILIASLIIAFFYKVKFNDVIDSVCAGLKRFALPAVLMMILYVCLIIATYHPFQLVIAKFFLGLTEGLNAFTMSIVAFFASLFNLDSMYVAASTVPYITTIITDAAQLEIVEVIFQAIYGFTMLFVPTSVILIGTLAYLNVSYGQWLKHIWKLLLELLVLLLVIFVILVLI